MTDGPARDEFQLQTELVADIQESTTTLGSLVSGLTATQATQIAKLRTAARWTALGLVLDLGLTLGGAFLVAKAYDNADHIAASQRQIDANQEALRVRQARSGPALCSLYDLFLDSYNPASVTAQANPAGYQDSFRQLESGAKIFGCEHAVRGRD